MNFSPRKVSSEYYLTSAFLVDLENCLASKRYKKCHGYITKSEKMQLNEYAKGNLKCQTSILGLQTELIRIIYFETNKKESFGKSIPNLIKNC